MNVRGPSSPIVPSAARLPAPRAERTHHDGGPAAPAAPAGATPSLWDMLTEDERTFFASQAALGPLTYRPRGGATDPPAPTGRRIDATA